MFGIGAYAGRMFTPEDDRKGAEPVVVMSYRDLAAEIRAWTRR